MAVPNNLQNMGYCDPNHDRFIRNLQLEQMRALQSQVQNQYNNQSSLQNALLAPFTPVTNPEPNPVLLLLE